VAGGFARHDKKMSPVLTFFAGLGLLVLFGWYFATDVGLRKRLLATTLVMLLVAFSIATIWPPKEKISSDSIFKAAPRSSFA